MSTDTATAPAASTCSTQTPTRSKKLSALSLRLAIVSLCAWPHSLIAQDVTARVSLASDGTQGDGDSQCWGNTASSSDGRYVVFLSYARNLVSGDTNHFPDVFRHDRLTGDTIRVNISTAGVQANDFSAFATVSADGRYVSFDSHANNLVPNDTNNARDVFLHDCATGITSLVSVDTFGIQGNDDSAVPSMSRDGRYIAFESRASNLVTSDTNNAVDVFVHDTWSGTTTRASVDSTGQEGNGPSGAPSISADGDLIAFESDATTLVSNDTNNVGDIFVHDMLTGRTTLVSVNSSGLQSDAVCSYPAISGNGAVVAFMSNAKNLAPPFNDGGPWGPQPAQVFTHDLVLGSTEMVTVDSRERPGDLNSYSSALSYDGRYVVFETYSDNLVRGDINQARDIFRRDRVLRTTELVSVSVFGKATKGDNVMPSISADGRYVAFQGFGSDLVPNDTNRASDVFMRGPELTMESSSTTVTAGQSVALTQFTGLPNNDVSLWVVAVNSAPTLTLLVRGTFYQDGTFVSSGVVPPGMGGNTVSFRGYAVGKSRLLVQTNDVTIHFQ